MKKIEFIDIVRGIELALFSPEIRESLKKKTNDEKKAFISLRTEVGSYRSRLETGSLEVLADKLKELASSFEEGADELQEEIEKSESFIKVMDTLGRVLGLVSRVVTLTV